MKRYENNMEARTVWCERAICNMHGLTPEQYTEMMYETGCQFVEQLFKSEGRTGNALRKVVHRYITSYLFWYYWMIEWVDTCEAYLDWDYSKKTLTDLVDMQKQAKRPWKLLHDKIIKEQKCREKAGTI